MSTTRLLQRLLSASLKELDTWKPFSYATHSDESGLIGRAQRGRAVKSMLTLNDRLGFHPETLTLAVDILDQFLSLVKAHSKYLHCISVACVYLAAKTLEENEVLPTTLVLVRVSECGCSVAEVLRMERCILDKLEWNVGRVVGSIDFLHIFHALLLAECPALLDVTAASLRRTSSPMAEASLLAWLEARLCQSLVCDGLLQFSPSTRAIALVCLELDDSLPPPLTPAFLLHRLSSLIQVDIQSVLVCQKLLLVHTARGVRGGRASSCGHGARLAPFGTTYMRSGGSAPRGASKRKRGGGVARTADEENIYEGIKRLYEMDLALSVEHAV